MTCSPSYVVLEAGTGEDGLAIYRSEPVDCVLTELTLPDMSGFQVLLKMVPRARYPRIAVIIFTRLFLEPITQFAANNGAQACLIKSQTSVKDLDHAIRRAVALVGPNKERQSES